MKKLGIGKKKDGDNDSNRRALFGGRSKDKPPAPATNNPYANLPTQADAYNQAKARAGVPGYTQVPRGPSPAPPPAQQGGYGGMNGNYPDEKKSGGHGDEKKIGGHEGISDPAPQNGGGYGADRYGASTGYGADRYGAESSQAGGGGSRYGPGGYGGLGAAPVPDDTKDALFGGAKERVQKQDPQQMGYGQPPPYEEGGREGEYGGRSGSSYEAYGDRQLTAEEEEEEDVQATKQQIRFIKQEDVSSTRNALRMAAQAEETGMNTLARIGAQGERIHNTEKNLDITANHNRVAEDRAKELKKLNRSMFAVHVSNPFTAESRTRRADEDVLEKHQLERAQREATRRAGYDTDQRLQKTFKEISQEGPNAAAKKQASLAERAKYQFEADSEDDEMENEIDSNLDALGGAASRLNGLARATGKEVDEQNRHLERINAKSTKVDDEIALNRARLDRFH
ncbi:MAG: Protein transport protein S9 plasma membrane t-SNARE [Alectoria sarmentosa]|nr:MAG: Protein transport protein S9 plasma membrane t-SNARE [Alectoria sarmentosa]